MSARLDLFLYLFMAAAFGGALWLGRDWPAPARIFPFLISGAGLLLVAAGLLQGMIAKQRDQRDQGQHGTTLLKELATFAWISAFFGAVALFGFQWGLPAIIVVYLKREAELSFVPSLLFTALCWFFIYLMRAYLYIPLYEGWLSSLSRDLGSPF